MNVEQVGDTPFQPFFSQATANEIARVVGRGDRNVAEAWGIDTDLIETVAEGLVIVLKENGASIGVDDAYLSRQDLEVALQTAFASGIELATAAIALGRWTPDVPEFAWPVEYQGVDTQTVTIVPFGMS